MDKVSVFRSVDFPPHVDIEEFLVKTSNVTKIIERALELNLLMGRGEDPEDPELRSIRLFGSHNDLQFMRGFIAGLHTNRW